MSRKTKRNPPNPQRAERQGRQSPRATRSGRRNLYVGSVVAVLLAVLVGALLFNGKGAPSSQQAADAYQAALASNHSPTLGDANAKVHIVEFLDPACETCAQFFPLVQQLMAENPNRIRLSTRHVAFHNGSDYVVRLLEASRKQDRYWQTLEAVLASQAQWAPNHTAQPELVRQAIAGVGLNIEQLMADMNSPEVARNMQQDASDAITLKVTATPEYFVNGRPLPSFGEQQLLDLVREELQTNY